MNPLPELIDRAGIVAELGVTRAAAEQIMRQLTLIEFEGLRKVYVDRAELAALIASRRSPLEGVQSPRQTQAARQRVNAPGPATEVRPMRGES